MISTLSHSLPIAAVIGGAAASLLAWAAADPLTGLAVASGALFVSWLTAMFAAQYLPAPIPHQHGNGRH